MEFWHHHCCMYTCSCQELCFLWFCLVLLYFSWRWGWGTSLQQLNSGLNVYMFLPLKMFDIVTRACNTSNAQPLYTVHACVYIHTYMCMYSMYVHTCTHQDYVYIVPVLSDELQASGAVQITSVLRVMLAMPLFPVYSFSLMSDDKGSVISKESISWKEFALTSLICMYMLNWGRR